MWYDRVETLSVNRRVMIRFSVTDLGRLLIRAKEDFIERWRQRRGRDVRHGAAVLKLSPGTHADALKSHRSTHTFRRILHAHTFNAGSYMLMSLYLKSDHNKK